MVTEGTLKAIRERRAAQIRGEELLKEYNTYRGNTPEALARNAAIEAEFLTLEPLLKQTPYPAETIDALLSTVDALVEGLSPIAALWEAFDNSAAIDAGLLAWLNNSVPEQRLVYAVVKAYKAHLAAQQQDGKAGE